MLGNAMQIEWMSERVTNGNNEKKESQEEKNFERQQEIRVKKFSLAQIT